MKKNNKLSFPTSLSFQNHLILSYTFILILILAVGIFLYQMSYHQVKEGINERNTTMLDSSVRRLDHTMSTISNVAQQISASSSFNSLVLHDPAQVDDFNYLAYKTQHELKPIFVSERILPVSAFFIYMENSGYVISPSEFQSFDSYAKYKLFCPPDMTQKFENSLNIESNRNRFMSMQEFDSRRDGFLYFYPIASGSVFSEKYIKAYLCCMFDQDLIEDFFPGLLLENTTISAYDSNGNQKFQILAPAAGLPPAAADPLTISALSDYNSWEYILTQPKEQAYYSINNYRTLFITIAVIAILLEALMVYYFSVINSKPVAKLANELVDKEKLASSLNELVEKNQPLVTESYLRRIMEGSLVTSDEIEYIAEELKLNRSGVKFQVLYLEVYPSEDFNVQLDDMALCLQNFDVLVRDGLKRHFPDTGYLYKPSDRIFSVLLAVPDSMTYEQIKFHNLETFTSLHTELLNDFGIWTRGGFGGLNGKLANTWKSYQQAKDAKSITTAEHYVQDYQDFIHSDDIYYYPEIMSVQLTGAISAGNKDLVNEVFHLITKENTVNRTLPHPQRRQLISDIRSTLFKKRHSIALGSKEELKDKLNVIDLQFEDEMSLAMLKKIALDLCELFVSEHSANELIVEIQNYISENYHDPSLCLAKISDEFNISENYFSFLFKKEVHENFSGYLEKLRMAKARELVKNSDTSLSTLYQFVGYSNAASFRRVFKKIFGISPKEMREQNNA